MINTAYPLPLDTAYRLSGTEAEILPGFNILSDQEYSEEEEAKAMEKTMEQYMSKTRTNYGSGVARPKIEERIILDSIGAIPSKTAADAKVAIKEMVEYFQNGIMEHLEEEVLRLLTDWLLYK
ncbi:hypothetical protein Tco_1528693, partial [Tanacetum coccineum]